ncbi:glycosyltransferase family 2 protein [cf. Phormidesmis sp. LEGE 11477]|uniref:glycosyltransferase family 2 protein n=1 Tax=cf. Phormidesmis sp. LEGE 11477 TaxID=1828680 RepID=UPI00187DF0EB|nr:glycosyltransferase family 2 protein [cf. Phormidesmis sp. LEGE 11477]MBE9063608.1 glycosyltransferase [cf. Phormidesmis sp. LEGE 11477]
MSEIPIQLSVITAVYNSRLFIGECIENVISQYCKSVEHIIVDGGSTDGTVKIIQRYANQYNHIHWISEPDEGQSDAINKGLGLARGQIVGLLNADDYYEPHALNSAIFYFQTLPQPSLLVGNCNVWDDKGLKLSVNRPTKLQLEDLLLGFHVNPFPINPSAYFYHASLHNLIGPYDIKEHYVLDVDFLFRAVRVANVAYLDKILGNYHMLENTKTVESIKSGQSPLRVERVIKQYRRDFPLWKRLELAAKYSFFKATRRGRSWIWKRLPSQLSNSVQR